jgi:hypothetical protein
VADSFDRVIGAMDGLPGVHKTRPTTITTVQPILGNAQSFVVQTYKDKDEGYFITVQSVSAEGSIRIILPPKVALTIYRQREALVKKARSALGKARWEAMSPEQREQAVARLHKT